MANIRQVSLWPYLFSLNPQLGTLATTLGYENLDMIEYRATKSLIVCQCHSMPIAALWQRNKLLPCLNHGYLGAFNMVKLTYTSNFINREYAGKCVDITVSLYSFVSVYEGIRLTPALCILQLCSRRKEYSSSNLEKNLCKAHGLCWNTMLGAMEKCHTCHWASQERPTLVYLIIMPLTFGSSCLLLTA